MVILGLRCWLTGKQVSRFIQQPKAILSCPLVSRWVIWFIWTMGRCVSVKAVLGALHVLKHFQGHSPVYGLCWYYRLREEVSQVVNRGCFPESFVLIKKRLIWKVSEKLKVWHGELLSLAPPHLSLLSSRKMLFLLYSLHSVSLDTVLLIPTLQLYYDIYWHFMDEEVKAQNVTPNSHCYCRLNCILQKFILKLHFPIPWNLNVFGWVIRKIINVI